MTGSACFAQEPLGWSHVDEETYISKGLNFKKDWGTFVLRPGRGGRAIYLKNGVARSVLLHYTGIFQSKDSPGVEYWVFRETTPDAVTKKARQWAFQIDHPGLNGFVIYSKEDESDPFLAEGWSIYDFAQ